MAWESTLRGYLSWIGVTLFFLSMGVNSEAMTVGFNGLDGGLVQSTAPFVSVASAILTAILGWRGSLDDYEPWEAFIVIFVPFLVTLGYVPAFEAQVSAVDGLMLVYNYITWVLTTTVIWILSKGH